MFLGHLSGLGVGTFWSIQRAGPQGLLLLSSLYFNPLIQWPFVAKAQVLSTLAILCGGGPQPPTCQMGALVEVE